MNQIYCEENRNYCKDFQYILRFSTEMYLDNQKEPTRDLPDYLLQIFVNNTNIDLNSMQSN